MLVQENNFGVNLIKDVVKAISEGKSKMVIWGATPEGLHVLSFLVCSGFSTYISGIIDQRHFMQGQVFSNHQVRPPESLVEMDIDTLVIASDQNKEEALERFLELDSRIPHVIVAGNLHYEFDDLVYSQVLKSCPVKSKAGGYPNMLIHLYQTLKYLAERKLEGDVVEFGVYQGGTTVFMAKVLEALKYPRKIYGFDTFAGFPQPRNALDVYRDAKCEFPDFETVKRYCSPYNIELILGDICQTYVRLRGVPLALSFFDTDNYSPTKQALEMCFEQTVSGGILAFDHYYSPNWEKTIGERIAIKQVLAGKQVLNLHGTGIFIKI